MSNAPVPFLLIAFGAIIMLALLLGDLRHQVTRLETRVIRLEGRP